jgi:hypothetical protein
MLPNLHIRRSQKIGLGLIFSICGVTIGLEILRVYKTLPGGVFGNVILYGILEANFSVIVSCIPTYRSLLGVERRTKGKDYAHWDWSKRSKTARSAGDDTALTKSQTNSNRSLTGIKVNQTWEQISEVRDSSTDSVQLNTMPPTAVLKG